MYTRILTCCLHIVFADGMTIDADALTEIYQVG